MKKVRQRTNLSQLYKSMISLICGILKNGTNKRIYKTEIESQMEKTILWLWGEGCGEEG